MAQNLGTTRMTRAFLSVLWQGGRFVVVSSSLGRLRELPEGLWERFGEARTFDPRLYGELVRFGRVLSWP